MGDRHQRTKPSALTRSEEKKKKSKKAASDSSKYELSKLKGQSLLSEGIEEMVGILYRPKTPETRQTYEAILSFIQDFLGDQPRDILCGAADEILNVMKSEKLKNKERRLEAESLVGALNDEKYSLLYGLCKKINDYGLDEKPSQIVDENIDETYGVNVQFEESEDEEADDFMAEVKEDEEDEQEGEEAAVGSTLHATNLDSKSTIAGQSGKSSTVLHPREIDAYWLQRKLSKTYDDPVVAQAKAAQVFKILKTAAEDRDVEDKLVYLLGFNQFDFIKLLRQNRQMILYCTLLASAQSAAEKNKLRERMNSDPQLVQYLNMLESTDENSEFSEKDAKGLYFKEKELTDVMEEDEQESEPESNIKILDLDDLAFAQGSHFMANKRCELPDGSFRKQRKGYEEIHVPALKPSPFDPNEVSLILIIILIIFLGFIGK